VPAPRNADSGTRPKAMQPTAAAAAASAAAQAAPGAGEAVAIEDPRGEAAAVAAALPATVLGFAIFSHAKLVALGGEQKGSGGGGGGSGGALISDCATPAPLVAGLCCPKRVGGGGGGGSGADDGCLLVWGLKWDPFSGVRDIMGQLCGVREPGMHVV